MCLNFLETEGLGQRRRAHDGGGCLSFTNSRCLKCRPNVHNHQSITVSALERAEQRTNGYHVHLATTKQEPKPLSPKDSLPSQTPLIQHIILAIPALCGVLRFLFPSVGNNGLFDIVGINQITPCFEVKIEDGLMLLDPRSLRFTWWNRFRRI